MKRLGLLSMLFFFLLTTHGRSQAEPNQGLDPAALERWRSMRFGMFIHWGPVSLKGTEIGWSRGREIPVETYDQLFRQFDPQEFNADAWVKTARDAGMKYLVITTKHHDGFCLWPSRFTDYDIEGTPFGRDILKELSESCRRYGIKFGTYYSVCDWYHRDFPLGSPGGKIEKPNPNLDRYIRYLRNQVTELITGYGPLSTMWFDVPQRVGPEHGLETVAMVRRLQPDILINNRAYFGEGRTRGANKQTDVGDYSTPEQHVGEFNRDRPWETCMTIGRQWAWKPNDEIKSLKQCLQTLLQTVGGDGNLLFNVGPMPNGKIESRQIERLKEMGKWLAQYGDTVYGTRGGPFKPGSWGASTCSGNQIFLHIMYWSDNGSLRLPPLQAQITSVRTRTQGEAQIQQDADGISVRLDKSDQDAISTVIELTIDRPALQIQPVSVEP